jgi:hypothetical protein
MRPILFNFLIFKACISLARMLIFRNNKVKPVRNYTNIGNGL